MTCPHCQDDSRCKGFRDRAALTLLGVTVWLWRTYRAKWVLAVTGLPCVFMYTMSMWALGRILWPLGAGLSAAMNGESAAALSNPVPWVALVLAALGALMLMEAIRIFLSGIGRPPAPEAVVVSAGA